MTVINLHTLSEDVLPKKTVLCLGNFDGVHIGHQKLILETVNAKDKLSLANDNIYSGVLFFKGSPKELITGTSVPLIINQIDKLKLFKGLGLDYAIVLDFENVMDMAADDFVSKILISELGCIHAVCGYNFTFGKKAAGHADDLLRLMNGNATIIDKVSVNGIDVSSSKIREFISKGNVALVNLLLGRNYSISGTVIHGKKLGRAIGIPTINMQIDKGYAVLKNGIYISKVRINGTLFEAVSNIGIRPSVKDNDLINCETHIIGFDGDLYGENLSVEFLEFIRDEKRFDSIIELKNQIIKDINTAKEYFKK